MFILAAAGKHPPWLAGEGVRKGVMGLLLPMATGAWSSQEPGAHLGQETRDSPMVRAEDRRSHRVRAPCYHCQVGCQL